MDKYFVEYGALQANARHLIECDTSALPPKKITEAFAREIADALNSYEPPCPDGTEPGKPERHLSNGEAPEGDEVMTRDEKEYVAQRKCELIDTRQKLMSVAKWFDDHLEIHGTDQYVRGMDIAWCIRRVVDKVDSAVDIMKIVLDEEETE